MYIGTIATFVSISICNVTESILFGLFDCEVNKHIYIVAIFEPIFTTFETIASRLNLVVCAKTIYKFRPIITSQRNDLWKKSYINRLRMWFYGDYQKKCGVGYKNYFSVYKLELPI